jgi:predicted GNAT family N-acyltransferase
VTIELFGIGDPRIDAAIALRITVFVDEQNVPIEEEVDVHDRVDLAAVHAIARADDGGVVGAGRFYERDPATVQIGRLAVAAEARGRGIGAALVTALMDEARRRGYAHAVLDAQVQAQAFYARLGYVPFGATLVDGGILHQPMRRDL